MEKYDPLFRYLNQTSKSQIILTYAEIERILSEKLPDSAYKYKQWWDNNSHVQSKSWRDAGYKVDTVHLGDKPFFFDEPTSFVACVQRIFLLAYTVGNLTEDTLNFYRRKISVRLK